MNRHLRVFLTLVVTMLTTTIMAQVPISGTYTIQNKKTGGYVQVKNRYYAKPDASAADASKIYVGVGVKNDRTLDLKDGKADFRANEPESYRLYSLAMRDGNGAKDGSTNIECYNYLNTAVGLATKVANRVVREMYASDAVKQSSLSALTDMISQEAMAAFADSVINYYREDYAYLTIQPLSAEGNLTKEGTSTDVYAKVVIPEMPEACNAIYKYYVKGCSIN